MSTITERPRGLLSTAPWLPFRGEAPCGQRPPGPTDDVAQAFPAGAGGERAPLLLPAPTAPARLTDRCCALCCQLAGTFDDAAVDAAGRRKNRRQQSKAPYDCDGGACERFDYCVVGAGAAGLQVGALFEKAERSYVVLERAGGAGSFFRKFPIHRQLISINKRNTGRGGSPLALE
eukprot:COSAG04_NODE_9847_length_827_cov_4.144231_1_plen_175_part_01